MQGDAKGPLSRVWYRDLVCDRAMWLLLAVGLLLSLALGLAGAGGFWAALPVIITTLWAMLRADLPAKLVRPAPSGVADRTSAQSAARMGLLGELLTVVPDSALVIDRDGTVILANAAAVALFPAPIGRQIALVTRAPELLAAVEDVATSGAKRDLDFKLPPPHEQAFAARVGPIERPVTGERGTVLVLLKDVTEQERLARMRADFVANASHELRTPLASLKGFVETLQSAAKDDPKAREQFLAIMHEQALRMARLIDDLLSLSRIEMREHVPPGGTADLAIIVDEVCEALRPLAESAEVELRIGEVVRPGAVVGDKDELAQVVHNLVHNAIKYGRRGGRVDISLVEERAGLVLRVADDGIGIAPEHLPRLTERFYRVSAKASRERGGTGLGLAIVKHIVSRHRGQLRIASELGKGSAFEVVLPATRTSA